MIEEIFSPLIKAVQEDSEKVKIINAKIYSENILIISKILVLRIAK
jgi:hypothetical protein